MYLLNHYVVDWNKVKNIDDVVEILKMLDISISPDTNLTTTQKYLLKLEEKEAYYREHNTFD